MPDSLDPGRAETPEVEAALPAEVPGWWERVHGHLHRNKAMSATTKLVVTAVGTAVLCAGLIMMVTPGPGLLGIVAGLAILSTEWEWADRWLSGARRKLEEARRAAEQMDPAVRRRRAIAIVAVMAASIAASVGYVLIWDWPGWSLLAWDRAQSFIGFLPELPGM